MQYVKVTFAITSQDMSDMLMAMLSDAGYNGFEETGNELFAYIETPQFKEEELAAVAGGYGIAYSTEIIPAQNWNALWESNFQPVVVDSFCTIRAHFHDIAVTTPYDIIITPKMSFGTGHHATTQLMIMMMKDIDFKGRSVLDFGTGTGVLAILAEMLGASSVLAIDNDEWSVENTLENTARNHCKNIIVQQASVEDTQAGKSDVILANINRHILLQYMPVLYQKLNEHGVILMSGLLAADKEIILEAAAAAGFELKRVNQQTNWIALLFEKKHVN